MAALDLCSVELDPKPNCSVESGPSQIQTNARSGTRGLRGANLAQGIKESVMTGSIYLALTEKLFQPTDLLEWLVGVPAEDRTYVAYKAVCTELPPNQQYLQDSFHFLCKEPVYVGIAIYYGLSSELKAQALPSPGRLNLNSSSGSTDQSTRAQSPPSDQNWPLTNYTRETVFKLNNTPELKQHLGLILGTKIKSDYLQMRLVTSYRARNFPKLKAPSELIQQALVHADWVQKFEYNQDLAPMVLRRVTILQERAPLYYARVGWKAYYPVVQKLEEDKLFSNLTRAQLKILHSFFSGVIDGRIFKYGDLGYKLAMLNRNALGYILGFPIDYMLPSPDQIHQAIVQIESEGIPSYLESNRAYIRSRCQVAVPTDHPTTNDPTAANEQASAPSIQIVNPEDVLAEPIENYVAFDLVIYQQGLHVHRFSRPEFRSLIQSQKNPWTGEILSPGILMAMRARLELAKTLGFPPARPLAEMLSRVAAGTFFEPEPSSSDTDPSSDLDRAEPIWSDLPEVEIIVGVVPWRFL